MEELLYFSEYFLVNKPESEKKFKDQKIFDFNLFVDSPYYVDIQLLEKSSSNEMRDAFKTFKDACTYLILFMKNKGFNPLEEKDYQKLLTFIAKSELKGLHLGYSYPTSTGRSLNENIRQQILDNIKTVVELDIVNPNLVPLAAIFTEGFGCDSSSDFIIHIIKEHIYQYNERIINELKLNDFKMISIDKHTLLKNPFKNEPVLLLPMDVLSDLPIAYNFTDIGTVCDINEEARKALANIFDIESSKYIKKSELLSLLKNKDAFSLILENYDKADAKSIERDYSLLRFSRTVKDEWKSIFEKSKIQNIENVLNISLKTLKHDLEDCGGRNFVNDKTKEKEFQRFYKLILETMRNFFDFDHNIETNNGDGPVDFKISYGDKNIALEFKKSLLVINI